MSTNEQKSAQSRKDRPKFSSPFYGCDYFTRNVLPVQITAGRRTVSSEVPPSQHNDIVCLLVMSGSGRLFINAREYSVGRGSVFMLGPFHNYSILPDSDSKIELYEVHLNNGAYLYLIACPYYKISSMDIPREPVFLRYNETETVYLDGLMQQLTKCCQPGNFRRAQTSFLLALKLYGIMSAKMYAQSDRDT